MKTEVRYKLISRRVIGGVTYLCNLKVFQMIGHVLKTHCII